MTQSRTRTRPCCDSRRTTDSSRACAVPAPRGSSISRRKSQRPMRRSDRGASRCQPATVTFHVHQAARPARWPIPKSAARCTSCRWASLAVASTRRRNRRFRRVAERAGPGHRPSSGDPRCAVGDDAVEVSRPGGARLSSERDRLLGHRAEDTRTRCSISALAGRRATISPRAACPRGRHRRRAAGRRPSHASRSHTSISRIRSAPRRWPCSTRSGATIRQRPLEASVHALKGAACLLVEDRNGRERTGPARARRRAGSQTVARLARRR